ncbi:MAG TPA: EAL domain-containing protein [Dongiaceae bacterium]|nr:EAL domain-containing protein [Dongiaceae bacterium]
MLLVDDDDEDLYYLKRLLKQSGRSHDVLEARNVDQAVEQLQQQPDLVLLDFYLGHQTAFDLLQRMQKSGCQLPVILLTGHDDAEIDQLALNKGIADYLPKRLVNPTILDRSIRYAHRDFQRLQQLEYLAHYDTLTGLCNRRLFMDRLQHAYENAKRHCTTGALLYIDVDGFKQINDDLGHATGDELLKVVAERMSLVVRSADTVARFGGDEFVILLENIGAPEAHRVAQKLLYAMEKPVPLRTGPVQCSLSIGLCGFSADSGSPDEILSSADRALYQAKLIGKHTYCSFNQRLMESLTRRTLIERLAQQAVDTGDFFLHYQPRMSSHSHHVAGFEALARWPRRENVELSPADFIPVLETLGLMDRFTQWVIDKALADFPRLQKWAPGCVLSFNMSSSSFANDRVKDYLLQKVEKAGIDPTCIEVEVTESLFIERPESAVRILSELRAKGVRVALDDFGTGYSSLSYLNQLPIDTIKLDRQFLEQVPAVPRSTLLVATIVDLACNLELNVVAEGVEHEPQKLFLQSCGCHEMQGYLTGKPMSLDELQVFFSGPV